MIEDVLRDLTPQVVSALVRRYGDFGKCEDAVQEALLAAAVQWPRDGVPDNPRAWLITTASRRRIEMWRSEAARIRREETVAALEPPDPEPVVQDDTLALLMLCCHPALTRPSQVALTLRAVGGLTTAEIARAFLVPEPTIGQRISRAKQKLRGADFVLPPPGELPDRVAAVLQVLYLVFTEGHTASAGEAVNRVELTAEAIRLTRQLHAQLPEDGEVTGLLALMLLTDARRPARTGPGGVPIPLADQDRSRWDASAIAEGSALIEHALSTSAVGPYQLQAAIAAVHDEAPTADATDWPQILLLYDLLQQLAPGPMVTLNRLVALAQVEGPAAALAELDALDQLDHYRVDVVRAHLLELSGDAAGARACYQRAARRTLSLPERAYFESRVLPDMPGKV
ncbi:RNA polymerase sigma factor [Amycolatopsis benzoatilytica]|uniref:RNA polymerase sigma factor n=1 Tax=Amycolatopsis benzoatilytica TaxID=346045 RepID=UPI00036BE702|nr:sigma-70 family RNA polymerase sigma factor [Amycolatopsis benzoatilytica]